MQKPKILAFDIETRPLLGYTWGTHEQDVIKVVQDWCILSFACKWVGEKKTEVYALPDFNLYKKDPNNDIELVKKLHEKFNEADVLLAQNGDAFDVKKVNARFLYHGMTPPSPYSTIDTLKIARKAFNLTSNKLGYIGQYIGLGGKEDTGGFKLWDDCLNGDMSAWKKMKLYNKRDVELLEQIYYRLLPWIKSPILGAYSTDGSTVCPYCTSKNIQKRGFAATRSQWYQQYWCKDCNGWFRGRASIGRFVPN